MRNRSVRSVRYLWQQERKQKNVSWFRQTLKFRSFWRGTRGSYRFGIICDLHKKLEYVTGRESRWKSGLCTGYKVSYGKAENRNWSIGVQKWPIPLKIGGWLFPGFTTATFSQSLWLRPLPTSVTFGRCAAHGALQNWVKYFQDSIFWQMTKLKNIE